MQSLGRFCKTNFGTIFEKVLVRFRSVRYLRYLHALGRVRSIVISKLTVFSAPAGWKYRKSYRVLRYSSTYREAYGKFFRSGTLLPDGSSSVPFFVFVLFVLFVFLFLVSFVFARSCPIAQQPSESFSLQSSINFLLPSLPFLCSNGCVFPVLPLHPLRKSQAGFNGSS